MSIGPEVEGRYRLTARCFVDMAGQSWTMHGPGTWFTVDEVAEHLRITPALVYKLISRKGLPGHKVGRQWRFHQPEVDAWVKAGQAATDSGHEAHAS